MHINWHEIFSPEAGIAHFFWGLVLLLLDTHLVGRLRRYFSKQPEEWARKKILAMTGILGGYTVMALLGAILLSRGLTMLGNIVRPKTNFRAEFVNCQLSDSNPMQHLFVVQMRIFNDGSPSVVKSWGLTITGVDKVTTPGLFVVDTLPPLTVEGVDGTKTVFEAKDSLTEKTRYSGFGNGDMRDGHVIFIIPDIKRQFLEAHGTLYTVHFQDTHSKQYDLEFRWPSPARK